MLTHEWNQSSRKASEMCEWHLGNGYLNAVVASSHLMNSPEKEKGSETVPIRSKVESEGCVRNDCHSDGE